jgi:hypothetical protein
VQALDWDQGLLVLSRGCGKEKYAETGGAVWRLFMSRDREHGPKRATIITHDRALLDQVWLHPPGDFYRTGPALGAIEFSVTFCPTYRRIGIEIYA